MSCPNSLALKRLKSEEKARKLGKEKENFIILPKKTDNKGDAFKYWDLFIFGFEDSIYEGCIFHCLLEIPENYSFSPPKMKFVTKIFHPNVYVNGKVCISILTTIADDPTHSLDPSLLWSPVHTLSSIALSVISILTEPNINSPANVDASNMFRKDLEEFEKEARKLAIIETEKAKKALQEQLEFCDKGVLERENVNEYLNYKFD